MELHLRLQKMPSKVSGFVMKKEPGRRTPFEDGAFDRCPPVHLWHFSSFIYFKGRGRVLKFLKIQRSGYLMVESQVRGVEIWGRYSIPVRNVIHSGMSCGAGNLMLAVSYGKHGCRYHMSGPSSGSRSFTRASGFCNVCNSGRVMSGGGWSLGVE